MDVLTALRAGGHEGLLTSGNVSAKYSKLAALISVTQRTLDSEEAGSGPVVRMMLANGIQIFTQSKFTLEGEKLLISVFLALFKRCALLWELLLKEGSVANKRCSQRLLLKLDYSQKLTSRIFNEAKLDVKLSLGGSTGVNVFILDLCVSTLQILPGRFPPDVTQIATAMILFLQQFQHYLPIDITPINPGHYVGLLETLIITAQPNKIEIDALELIAATLLQSITHYGWQTGLNDAISNIFTSTYSLSGKLSLLSKALYAYKPGIPGIEGLLNEEEISVLVKQLKDISLSMPKIDLHYSAREILLITQGVTRIPANCSGLIEKGIEEVLQCLMDKNNEKANKIIASISWQIATETTEVNSTITAIDASQDFISPQLEDQDGSLALTDTILQLLSQLIHDRNLDDLTEREICTMDTLVHTIFDLYLQSEIVLKHAIAKMFGDKYIRCLIDINEIVHNFVVLKVDTNANIAYGLLLQDMARLSEYFCEKANDSGLVGVLLVTVNSYQRYLVHEVYQSFLNNRLTTLFYCAHITKYLYFSFGLMSALDTLTTVLNSPVAYTRLLARLVICCLYPIMGDSQTKLLELTVEESELLLGFIRQPMQPAGVDPAKLLKAASVLFREFPTQTVSAHFFTELCESVVSLLYKNHDDCVTEGALCLLWTLSCYVPDIKHHIMSKMDNLIGVLTSLQQSPCSIVSSPARSILLVMGYHSYGDPDECYLCAISSLQYALYTKCIELCDQIISKIKSVPCGQVNLIRGKAYAHIHQRQLWHILNKRMLDVAVPWKTGDFVDRCASNAKKAIGDLGFALDQGVLDEDGSYLLDMAMINHVLIKKQLDDCHRCLLCRRRGVKLLKSHTIPKFILQEMTNQSSKKCKELGIEVDGLDFCQNVSGHFKFDSSKKALIYTLLCARCEQRLSQNGENQFQDQFIPPIYSGSNEIQNVVYDSNAYSFCLGILFRSFVNDSFFHFANADEIYSLFVACRQHLIQLPAKITEKKDIPNPPPVVGMRQISLPNAYLIINPSKLHIPNFNLSYLVGYMVFGAGTLFLSTPLNREPKNHLCHAAVVHMAVCNIIVPFTPAQTAPLDDSYRILPQGGVYPVLPEISRWNGTPPGVFKAIVNGSICGMRQYQQVLSGLKTTKGDSSKADTCIKSVEQLCDSFLLERGPIIDMTSLESMSIPPEEAELISLFVSTKSNIQVSLLPEDFGVIRSPPKLILREGYMLLYHIHDDDTNITYFFTANPSDILNGKLIVIMTVTEEADNYQRVEGVHVHIKKDSSVCVTGYLQEPTTETLKRIQYSRLSTVTERVIKAVNILLQRCGSPSTFIHCASIQTRCQNRVALNHKCTASGCWYCKNSCHICMDQANQGYTVTPGKKVMFLHCSEECKAMIENIPQFSTKILPGHVHVHDEGSRNLILMQSEGCFSSILCEYTVAQVIVCISVEAASVTYGKPFAVVQLRTIKQHVFFSTYLANDFSPTQPVYDFPLGFSFELLKDSDIISQVIKMSLHHSEISTISHLLMKVTEIDASLSQYFSITLSCEKFFCQDELEPLKKKLSDQDLCTAWMIEQITASNIALENEHQIQSLKTCSTHLPLLPSTGTLKCLFWNYFQLTCILWNEILTDKHTRNDSLVRKLGHAVRVATVVFEQSPLDTQSYIIKNFSLSSDILILCGRLAIAAIEGAIGYIEDETIQFIILVNKFIMAPVCTSMSISVATLNSLIPCDLESTVQHAQPNVSSVAHHLLLTTILKVLQTTGIDTINDVDSLSDLKSYVLSLLSSPFMLVAVLAKAVAHLLTYPQVTKNNMELTDGEVDHIATILCRLSQDKLTRVYFSSIILQVLRLLCSQPVNKTQFMQRGVVVHLQTLMEVSSEAEAGVIANILWTIISMENSDEVIDTKGDGQSIADFDSDVLLDISLTINQGLQNVFNCLLKIMEEFNSRYLECKQVLYAQAYTICTVVQLLKELHQIMETNEILELTKSIATFVKLFGSSITKHRKLWQSIPNGVLVVNAIEILMLTWAGIRETSQLLIGTGCLNLALNIAEGLTSNDVQSLQNQVGVVYKCARLFPMQVAFQLEYSNFQPLLNCSLILVRILTKCIFASVAKYREYPNILQCITLQKEEIAFISSRLTDSLASQRVTNVLPFSNPGEILHSLQILTSYPCDKRECVLPTLLDILTTTNLCDDKTVAKLALEILWNLSFDPSVALAIINHENVIFSLQKLVLNSSFSSLSTSTLWTLGRRKVQSIVCCWDYVLVCYHSGKYDEAITWCDHLLGTIEASNPLVTSVKNCKGKSLAQKYLCKQVQHLFRSGDWALLGYDNNAGTFKSITERMLSDLQVLSNELLKQLSLKDLHNWEDLLSLGLQAINLLGEVLDSNELDEEASELLDLLLIDYSKGAGELNKCKRCLLCRVAGDLTPIRLQPQQPSNDASVPKYSSMFDQNTFIFQSYMYLAGSQITFMFCSECQSLLSHYCHSGQQFIVQACDPIKDKPFKYDKSLYTCLVAHIAQNMPLTFSNCASNWKAIYAAFVACRQILLSPNKGCVSIPKLYFLINPFCSYTFNKHSLEMHQLLPESRNICALVANQQRVLDGADTHECTFFLFHTGAWNIVLFLGSDSKLPPEYLVNPNGGTYPIPSLKQRWVMLPFSVLQIFHDLIQADEYRGAFQSLLSSEGLVLSRPSGTSLPLFSYSARFLLPYRRIISFLPKQFCIQLDSENNIKSISVPEGHTVLGHSFDRDNDFTFILACVSDVKSQKKQFYYIFVCRLQGYFIVEAVFLKGKISLIPPITNPALFPMIPSLGIQEVHMIRQYIAKKLPVSLMKSLPVILMKYGQFDFIAASNYVDVTRNINLAVSVDTRCSSEGCWYCKHQCHSCFRESSIGYNYKRVDGCQLCHCSERCYHMHTGDIADSTVYDIVIGKDDFQLQPTCGTHLLLSATINMHTRLSKNTVMSSQLCVTYNHKNIPSGVVYVCTIFCTTEHHQQPLTLFVDHTLSPVKSVWPGLPLDIVETWREKALIKRALQPALDNLKCDSISTFLKTNFPCLICKFMDINGRIYSLLPNGEKVYVPSDVQEHSISPQDCIRNIQ